MSKHLVDSHLHVFDRGVAGAHARYVPAYDAPLAAWQDGARPHGITRGVLVQPSFLGTDNARLLAELQRAPHDLRGVAVVAPTVATPELERLQQAGIRGIRLNLAGVSHDLQPWTRADGVWDFVLASGWHVELHTDIGALPGVLKQLPAALPVVVDHMGKPETVSAADPTFKLLVRRAQHAPVHVKLSGAYRLGGRDAGAIAALWASELGPSRLLWGSDWPCTNHEDEADYPRLFDALHHWLDQAMLDAVLVTNPGRLYWRSGAPPS